MPVIWNMVLASDNLSGRIVAPYFPHIASAISSNLVLASTTDIEGGVWHSLWAQDDRMDGFELLVALLELRLVLVLGEQFGAGEFLAVADQGEHAIGVRIVVDVIGLGLPVQSEPVPLAAHVGGRWTGASPAWLAERVVAALFYRKRHPALGAGAGQGRGGALGHGGTGAKPTVRRAQACFQGFKREDVFLDTSLALALPASAWRVVRWREGINARLQSRFARVRVRLAHHTVHHQRPEQEWLLVEWPEAETAPTKYWLSNLPKSISMTKLVDTVKMRWRIERDYQELKQAFGLSHYEGRGWRGFHRHTTLTIAAFGFLVAERLIYPSRKKTPYFAKNLPYPTVSDREVPLRADRHGPDSSPTLRLAIARAFAVRLPHCPCCGRSTL